MTIASRIRRGRNAASYVEHVTPIAIAEQRSPETPLSDIAGAERAMDVINKIGGCGPIAQAYADRDHLRSIVVSIHDVEERQELLNTLKQCGIGNDPKGDDSIHIEPMSLLHYLEQHVQQVQALSAAMRKRGDDNFGKTSTMLGAYDILSKKEGRTDVRQSFHLAI